VLLKEGLPNLLTRTLTLIGTVEGYGAGIRQMPVPPWDKFLVESVEGTALAHLDKGLFEAHGRDEAGFEDEAGHDKMWYLVRDLALNNPTIPDDITPDLGAMGSMEIFKAHPALPLPLAMIIRVMSNVLNIEVFAARTFDWAEKVVSNPDLCSHAEEAALMVNCIRADEASHVGYLATALTEIKARTIIGEGGVHIPGTEVIDATLDHIFTNQTGQSLEDGRLFRVNQLKKSLEGNPRKDDILDEFFATGPEEFQYLR